MSHTPVLLREVIDLLDPKPGEVIIDATVGLGGHAHMFAEKVCSEGRVIGLEADEDNLKIAQNNLEKFDDCIELRHVNFRDIASLNLAEVDIVFADLGLSSPHLDDPSRGFTFREDAPLDMRYDRSEGITAVEMIESLKEEELADVFWKFGEIKSSRKLSRIIKGLGDIDTTFKLKECIKNKNILPQAFQALRIAVNNELGSLEVLLKEAPLMLRQGGRMGVISYHSLEDRMVKQAFRRLAEPETDPVTGQIVKEAVFKVLTKRPVVPSEEEVRTNSRSRSAKFRVIVKTCSML